MLFVSVALITLAVISYFILNYCHLWFSVKTVNSLPGPKAFPLIGNAYYFFRRSSDEFLDILIKVTEDYSSPFKFWMGNKLFIVIHEPDQIQVILQNNLKESMVYKFIEPLLGKGLLTAPELIWKKNRKTIASNFNGITLEKFFDVFVKESLILINKIEKIELCRNKIILHDHISKYALRTTYGIMTNIKIESVSNEINQCLEIIARIRKTFQSRIQNVFSYPNLIFNFIAMGRERSKDEKLLHSFINKLIQQHIYAQKTNIKSETTRKTFLDVLIKTFHKDGYPQDMICDNLITMILAGFDTTTITINFAIFMLANFPEIQEKVYKELWEIYGTESLNSAPIKYEDLQYMNYLERVIKETMRLFPAGPFIGRCLTEDVKIGEFMLPKGTEIICAILALHRNEKYWSNSLVFDPDRFLPGKIGTSHKYYMPFGYGPRNCIGMKYTMISMKINLASLIRTFIFKVEKSTQIDAIKLNMDITLHSIEPLEIIIKKRELH